MKSTFTTALIFCLSTGFAQKVQKISLDQNRILFSLEAGVISGSMTFDGNAKYYNIWYNLGGYSQDFPDFKSGIGFHLGGDLEWHPLKNRGILGICFGAFYDSYGKSATYITHDPNFVKNPSTDTIAAIKQQAIGVPVYLKLRLGKFKLLDEGIFIKAGVYFSYLLSTNLEPISVKSEFGTDPLGNPVISGTRSASTDFSQLNYYPYAGIEYRIWRISLNLGFGITQYSKVLTNKVADYNAGKAKFQKDFATFTVQYYL